MTPSQKILKESLELNLVMAEALHAAADLLRHCTCQQARRQQALAAVGLADAALDRMERLNNSLQRMRATPAPMPAFSSLTLDERLRLPCGICGKGRSQHIGRAYGCPGGYGTSWNPAGEPDPRLKGTE
jgi:hypothetical protein